MIFSDINEIREFIPINRSLEFSDIKPAIRTAARDWIIPALSQAEYDELVSQYQSGTPSAPYEALLELAREANIYFAMRIFQPMIDSMVSSSGNHQVQTENKMPVPRWKTRDQQDTYQLQAYRALDKMMQFLEENQASFPNWAASDAFTEYTEFLVYKTAVFQKHINISGSRRFFSALRPQIRCAEEVLEKALSSGYYAEILSELHAGTLTPANRIILETYAQPAISFLAMEDGITELAVKKTVDGFYLFANLNRDGDMEVKHAEQHHLDASRRQYKSKADSKISDMVDYLESNIGNYPTYAASDNYTPPEDEPIKNEESTGGKIIMF